MVDAGQCRVCGTAVTADANFCAACGTPVSRNDGERTEALPVVHLGHGDQPVLVITHGSSGVQRHEITAARTTIGRHPSSDVFLDDVTVSRHHAVIEASEGQLVLTDSGSLNGTYVNGARVDRHVLAPADQIQVGKFRLLFVLEAADGDR